MAWLLASPPVVKIRTGAMGIIETGNRYARHTICPQTYVSKALPSGLYYKQSASSFNFERTLLAASSVTSLQDRLLIRRPTLDTNWI